MCHSEHPAQPKEKVWYRMALKLLTLCLTTGRTQEVFPATRLGESLASCPMSDQTSSIWPCARFILSVGLVVGFLDRQQAMGGQVSILLVLCCGPEVCHTANSLYIDINNEQTNKLRRPEQISSNAWSAVCSQRALFFWPIEGKTRTKWWSSFGSKSGRIF